MIGWLVRHRIAVANLALVLILLVGVGNLMFNTLRINPFRDTYAVTVKFAQSGGIYEQSPITLNGYRIGSVEKLALDRNDNTVTVTARLEKKYKINRNAMVQVLGLSPAGEQYLDFANTNGDGPYLRDGDVIRSSQTVVSFPKLLADSQTLVTQIQPDQLRTLVDNLQIALSGRDQLQTLFDSGGVIAGKLYKVLPETSQLIRNTGTILATSRNIQPDLGRFTSSASKLVGEINRANGEIEKLLRNGPSQINSLSGAFNQLRNPLTDLLRNVRDIGAQGVSRAPALASLIPAMVRGVTDFSEVAHDNGLWQVVELGLTPYCEYPITPASPTKLLSDSVPVNLYCVTEDKRQMIRGAANAPRPPGDDTAGPPPGYDPNARSVPLK